MEKNLLEMQLAQKVKQLREIRARERAIKAEITALEARRAKS